MQGDQLLMHMHIPKCAGQWLDDVFYRIFEHPQYRKNSKVRRKSAMLLLEDPKYKANIEAFSTKIEANSGVRVVSSQKFMHHFPDHLGGRRVQYITILREPGAQLLSFLRYAISGYGSFKEGFQSRLPEGLGDMSLEDAATKLITERPGLVTHFLPVRHLSATGNEAESMENLSKISFLGTVEKCELLAARILHWMDPAVPISSVLPSEPVNSTQVNTEENSRVRSLPVFQDYLSWDPVQISTRLWEHARQFEHAESGSPQR